MIICKKEEKMKHYGDVTKINGAELEPVDVLTFGSPCQDLSVAGKRAGLKHEDNGDDETTRSGLFMEAVRIIREMREATNGRYPTFALWENVPGAFSSNKGEDFRIVLEEFIKIKEPTALAGDEHNRLAGIAVDLELHKPVQVAAPVLHIANFHNYNPKQSIKIGICFSQLASL